MAEANAHYYATRDPLGARGDFITAPEISQMFGELIGLWLADLWHRAGRPRAHYVELGPGRGTLAADALRAMRGAGLVPQVHLVETSPTLRAMQRERLGEVAWHDDIATVPGDAPLLVVANEFFDALPVRQILRTGSGWHERMVAHAAGGFFPVAGPSRWDAAVPEGLRTAPDGSILESAPASAAVMRMLAERLREQGGAAIVADYGYSGPALGDTLQAVKRHGFADPFVDPGESDLTAHVDFAALAQAAQSEGARVFGPTGQGVWLEALGIGARASALARAHPDRVAEIAQARRRLTAEEDMGTLFKTLAVVSPGWPAPEGFV